MSTPAIPRSVPGLAWQKSLANMGGNENLLRRLARLFIEQHGADVVLIDAALAERDFALALHLVHALRGTAANLGGERVHAAARAFEELLKSRTCLPARVPDELRAAMAELVPALEDLIAARPAAPG